MQIMHHYSIIALVLVFFSVSSHALPLSTKSRWIVDDDTGERVKLTCANWAGHLEPMLPEGLNKQPLDDIARQFSLMGFNCIRLTYATYMFTKHAQLTVEQNFQSLNLTGAIQGIRRYNQDLLGLTLVDAQKAVIHALASHGLMVLLDCQVSKPMWCCHNNDGNGFWGDKYFDPQDWLNALSVVSQRYRDTPMVMAMSLRNELRGPLQNRTVWSDYVAQGAKTIHRGNPNVLVLISGLQYDLDFSFLKRNPLTFSIGKKLVYETHRYSFSEGRHIWSEQSVNYVCQHMTREIDDKVGFLIKGKNPTPLFITEFGADQTGADQADDLFLSCFLTWLAENDLDWALWAGQGSYYLRDGLHDPDETFGLFDSTWKHVRSPTFLHKLQLIQGTLQDPFSRKGKNYLLYHPQSGNCGVADNDRVRAGDCRKTSIWIYKGEGSPIKLRGKGSNRCLTAVGEGLPVILKEDCSSEKSTWEFALNSRYQLANQDLCLEWDSHSSVVITTKKCIVAGEGGGNVPTRNPQIQWFILVESNTQ